MKELQSINPLFFKYKYRLIIGIIISILSRDFAVKIPELIKNSINTAHEYQIGHLKNIENVNHQLLMNILLIIGFALLSGFFTFLMRQTIIVTSRLIEYDLKNMVYDQYQKLSLNFYKKNRTGDLMSRISEDVGQVRMYAGPAIMYTINMLVLFSVALFKMLQINLTLTLWTLIPFPLLSISIFVLSKKIHEKSSIVQQYLSNLTTYAQEIFSGINVVKSYAIEKFVFKNFIHISDSSKDKNIELYKVQALFFPLMILLIGISNIIVLYVGGELYMNNKISLGVIAEFIMYVNMLTWPVAIVGWVSSTIQQAEASQKRINEFLKQQPEIINLSEEELLIDGKIEFKNVSLTYDDTNITALQNISFIINPGETVAILGKTGSGKSTILNLIARLYDPSTGVIYIDNKELPKININNFRNQIGVVPQDPFLFSDTIKNNIKFGKNNASDEEIIDAAKNAAIHTNIMEFSQQYNTILGERGVTLSGGQKQRTAIARAIIKNPTIYLLDDCLSAVDTETEVEIIQNLHKVSSNKTTFIVSHRVSAAQHADKIIFLEDGKIVEEGTHQTLVKANGPYQKLYEQQLHEKPKN